MGHFRWISGALTAAAFSLGTGCGLVESTPDDPLKPAGDADPETPVESEDDVEVAPVPDVPPDPSDSRGGAGGESIGPQLQTDFGDAPHAYRALEIATGRYHSCALLEDGRVKCWGINDYGQLGLGDTSERGAQPHEMGDALPFVDLGQGVRAKHINAGRYATCAILLDDSVQCWGLTYFGQTRVLGTKPDDMGDALPALPLSLEYRVIDVVLGVYEQCLVLADQSFICRKDGGDSTILPAATGTQLKDTVSTSRLGVLGLYTDNTLRLLWGDGPKITEPPNIIAPDTSFVASANKACFVRTNGDLDCPEHAPYPIARDLDFTQVGSTEISSSCGILKDGSINCWEQDSLDTDWSVPIESDSLDVSATRVVVDRPIVQISHLGWQHFCVLDVEGYVSCWNTQKTGHAPSVAAALSDADPTRLRPVDLGTYTGE